MTATSTAPEAASRSRARLGWVLAGVATLVWAVLVVAFGLVGRVLDNWESTVTMLFGSFLAGSSPEGGGAVAFPVFTKLLQVPAPVARTFGLSIQAVGMTMASISILLSGRSFHRRSVMIAIPAAVAGFVAALVAFGQPNHLFWPSSIGTAWVKASFSILLATTSFLMVRHVRQHAARGDGGHDQLRWNRRLDLAVICVAVAGGFLSSLTGTGANIVLFLFLVVLVGVAPQSALPSAIMVMTAVSIVGFVVFGLLDGQLDVEVVGDRLVSVGGAEADLDAGRADLLGLWLAAVPVVVWGAPLGSLAASLVKEHHLVGFVAALAAIEVLTTFLLVPELRTEAALIVYLLGGLIVLPVAFLLVERHRWSIFRAEPEI